MINCTYTCTKFDNEDLMIVLFIIAITIFYVGQHQRARYTVIFCVIGVVEMVLIGFLWWALRGTGPC